MILILLSYCRIVARPKGYPRMLFLSAQSAFIQFFILYYIHTFYINKENLNIFNYVKCPTNTFLINIQHKFTFNGNSFFYIYYILILFFLAETKSQNE